MSELEDRRSESPRPKTGIARSTMEFGGRRRRRLLLRARLFGLRCSIASAHNRSVALLSSSFSRPCRLPSREPDFFATGVNQLTHHENVLEKLPHPLNAAGAIAGNARPAARRNRGAHRGARGTSRSAIAARSVGD